MCVILSSLVYSQCMHDHLNTACHKKISSMFTICSRPSDLQANTIRGGGVPSLLTHLPLHHPTRTPIWIGLGPQGGAVALATPRQSRCCHCPCRRPRPRASGEAVVFTPEHFHPDCRPRRMSTLSCDREGERMQSSKQKKPLSRESSLSLATSDSSGRLEACASRRAEEHWKCCPREALGQ